MKNLILALIVLTSFNSFSQDGILYYRAFQGDSVERTLPNSFVIDSSSVELMDDDLVINIDESIKGEPRQLELDLSSDESLYFSKLIQKEGSVLAIKFNSNSSLNFKVYLNHSSGQIEVKRYLAIAQRADELDNGNYTNSWSSSWRKLHDLFSKRGTFKNSKFDSNIDDITKTNIDKNMKNKKSNSKRERE